jgi:hypothetical protein
MFVRSLSWKNIGVMHLCIDWCKGVSRTVTDSGAEGSRESAWCPAVAEHTVHCNSLDTWAGVDHQADGVLAAGLVVVVVGLLLLLLLLLVRMVRVSL